VIRSRTSDSPSILLSNNLEQDIYTCGAQPSLIDGELGFNRWKRTWVNPSVSASHPSSPIDATRLLATSADYPGIHPSYKHYIHPLSLHRYTSCRYLEAPTGTSTENLASTGGRGHGSTHQCLPIHNPKLLVVEIATTLSWSSAAVR